MLIDIHTHIFSPDVQMHRQRYCARDPWFNVLYGNPGVNIATAEDLIAEMDDSGVEVTVTFSIGWTDPGLIEECNSYIIDVVRRYEFASRDRLILRPVENQDELTWERIN